MVTRLRKFSTQTITKVVAFFLAVAMITAAVAVFQTANLKEIDKECILVKYYDISAAYKTEVDNALREVENAIYYGTELPDVPYYYYVSNGDRISSNTDNSDINFYKHNENFYVLKDGNWRNGIDENSELIKSSTNKRTTAYIYFGSAYMDERQQEWNRNRDLLITYFVISGVLALLGLIIIIFLVCVTGRKPQDKGIYLNKLDKIYTDIILAASGLLICFFINNFNEIFYDHYIRAIGIRLSRWGIEFFMDFRHQFVPSLIFFIIVIAALASIFLILLLTLVRRLKAHSFVRCSLIFKALQVVWQASIYYYKKIVYGEIIPGVTLTKTLYYRQMILIITSSVLILLGAAFIIGKSDWYLLPTVLEITLVFWYVKGNKRIYENIDHNIQDSVDEMMKSERMKVALITNVSHDLKTPLTSIISYVELLSKEEGLSDTTKDYINILKAKSDRLKNIVIDLFDLAKSTSGDIALDYEVLDLKKLMEQTLAEMGDQITASRQMIKTKLPDTPVNIKTDGKKLYRVFQNVIDNALKYSMPGTRIFIELEADKKETVATIKNTAGYEMNFTAEEILQRFTRGDQARTEEGSGLGLSIAESFTNVCGGKLDVKLDGDQFNVIISFHIIQE